jgi:GNAT superfamily N-acetyltransferase
MTTLIRNALPTDMHAVLALFRELRPDDPVIPAERMASLWHEITATERSKIVVAEVDGEIAACCMLAFIANLASGGRKIGLLEHVITASRFRRQGLGKQVLEFAIAQAWQADCCKVMLLSGANRPDAHRVYAAIGFQGDMERGFVIKAPSA